MTTSPATASTTPVLYTLTNSLTGAGIGKYILPGVGVAVALVAVFGALGWVLRRRRHHPHHVGYSLAALLLALASVDASPAFHQISGAGENPSHARAIQTLPRTIKSRRSKSTIRS
ncbi:phosphoglycerol transferase I [Klebsiella pneumoniae subsp. ozaenae]|uniref:Phosphoglycerol transferase I n=1 Tax=Klebsiella pneumoniae subsp. ozaenae TaxID=574 RepID=A0A377Z1F5_KLEPO|nr:phosphoglycerol transferase I [Klebsiella pneumoniae subsp. ozaenae]